MAADFARVVRAAGCNSWGTAGVAAKAQGTKCVFEVLSADAFYTCPQARVLFRVNPRRNS